MLSGCCFSAQHNSISTFHHCISHISYLTAVGLIEFDHALHHLGGYDNRLAPVKTFTDDLFLQQRNFFYR